MRSQPESSLASFVQSDGQLLLKSVEITEEHCDELEGQIQQQATSSSSTPLVVVVAVHNVKLVRTRGSVRRFLQIILRDGSGCSRLTIYNLDQLLLDCMHIINTSLASSESTLQFLDITSALGGDNDDDKSSQSTTIPDSPTDAVSILANGLSVNRHLKVLRMEDCFLQDFQVATVVTALRRHPCLQELSLSGNTLGEETSLALADLLQEPETCLHKLYLDMLSSSTGRGRNRTKLNIQSLANALRHNKSLHTLDLTDNMIDDDDLAMLGRSLMPEFIKFKLKTAGKAYNSSLQCLLLGRNRITDAGLSTLLYRQLYQMRGLKTLTLGGNLMEAMTSATTISSSDWGDRKIIKNRAIKAMIDLGDVELIKAVSRPEHVLMEQWPKLLRRLQEALKSKPELPSNKVEDLLYLLVRGPMVSTMGGFRAKRGTPNTPSPKIVNTTITSPPAVEQHLKEPNWKYNTRLLVQECAESPNPYLRDFASSSLADIFVKDDRVASSFGRRNRTSLRKELLEAAALDSRLNRIFKSDDLSDRMDDNIVIWDLCSGKGFSAIWLSTNTYPNAKIHMVDLDNKAKRGFLAAFPNIEYHHLDLYSEELEHLILQSVNDKAGTRVILVGIHLCGDLSRRALELQSRCGAAATFLSPCCAMRSVKVKKRKPGSFGYNVPKMSRQLKVVSPYELWCWMLWGHANVSPADTHRRLDLTHDLGMKTDKNAWLTVVDTKATSDESASLYCRATIDG